MAGGDGASFSPGQSELSSRRAAPVLLTPWADGSGAKGGSPQVSLQSPFISQTPEYGTLHSHLVTPNIRVIKRGQFPAFVLYRCGLSEGTR